MERVDESRLTLDDFAILYLRGARSQLIRDLYALEALHDSPSYIRKTDTMPVKFPKLTSTIYITNELAYLLLTQALDLNANDLAKYGVTDVEPYHVRTDICISNSYPR